MSQVLGYRGNPADIDELQYRWSTLDRPARIEVLQRILWDKCSEYRVATPWLIPSKQELNVRLDGNHVGVVGGQYHPINNSITLYWVAVTLKAGGVLFFPAEKAHWARKPGTTRGVELATYFVRKANHC